jgi:hypothetical protein
MTNPYQTLQTQLEQGDEVTAAYVGVPVTTWRKWVNGSREASTSGQRLIEVLGLLRTMAPAIHEHLLSSAVTLVKASKGVKP